MKTFRDFMAASLYAPGGYYSNRTPKEDFYTAPELHPVFAEILADEAALRFDDLAAAKVPEPYFIVEMGSGGGRLARGLSSSLRSRHPRWAGRVRLALVERCENLLIESIAAFGGTGESLLGFTRLDDMNPCAGVFLSNELVDAFPIHLLEKRDGRMKEVYVEDGEVLGRLSCPELEPFARAASPHLPEGARHAVNLEASRWLRRAARAMTAGTLITIDYGRRFGPGEANEPRAFFRHAAGASLTARPGRQDITASVDFEPLISQGRELGLETLAYVTLGRFLLERGILGRLPRPSVHGDFRAYRESNRIKTLFHPQGMGEAFKVLIQQKGLPA